MTQFSETASACVTLNDLVEVEATQEIIEVVETAWILTPEFFQSVPEPATRELGLREVYLFDLGEFENEDEVISFDEEGEACLPKEVYPY